MYLRYAALITIALAPVAASAATVSPIGGEVRVSTGQGFQKIVDPTEFPAGAQVLVSPSGSAKIAYAVDCVVQVKPGSLVAVQSWSPCKPLPQPMHFTPRVIGEEKKTSAQKSEESPKPVPPPQESSQPPQQTVSDDEDHRDIWGNYCLVGGVVVGAGALTAILLSQNNDHPASGH